MCQAGNCIVHIVHHHMIFYICALIFSQLFKYYIANTYITNIPMLCLLLYTAVYWKYDDGYRFITAFRICYVLLQLLQVSVAATIINSQVKITTIHHQNGKCEVSRAYKRYLSQEVIAKSLEQQRDITVESSEHHRGNYELSRTSER